MDESCALFPLNVRSTHPPELSASIENRFNDQIRRIGRIIHCVELIITIKEDRSHDRSGVVTFRREKRK